jgi:uncharacterized tellurite resistance protein B-like protein
MSELGSIESIESLAKDVRVQDGLFYVTFQSDPTEEEISVVVPARAPVAEAKPGAGAKSDAEEPFVFSVVRSANHLIRDLVGYNAAVSAAAVAVDSRIDQAESQTEAEAGAAGPADAALNDDEYDDALYRAFQRVMHLFAWNPGQEKWIIIHDAQGLSSELQRQLKLAPLESQEDRELLIRMLLDVAGVDGPIDGAEEEVLLDFVDRAEVTGTRPGARGRVSQNDLRRAGRGSSRETLYMLACAIAMADHNFKPEESDRLDFYAKGLGLDEHRAEELLEAGQMFFIEQYMVRRFAGRGELDEAARQELIDLAEHLNFDPDSAEYAFERYRRAHSGEGDGFY